jgi:uncharacterized protein YhbP (UPF0306 family)
MRANGEARMHDHGSSAARDIIDTNLYMVLGTADENGRPWASPVYYAVTEYRRFFWVSSPDARHSRNISLRPRIGIVIFNSQAPIGEGQGVYMSAEATEVGNGDLDYGLEVYSRRTRAHGGREWTADDVRGPTGIRFYRATALEHFVLAKDGRPDYRIPVNLES